MVTAQIVWELITWCTSEMSVFTQCVEECVYGGAEGKGGVKEIERLVCPLIYKEGRGLKNGRNVKGWDTFGATHHLLSVYTCARIS